jgi:hypothetical protein
MNRWMFQALALALLLTSILLGLIALGKWSKEQVRDRERYQAAFADIDCNPPPGLARGEFLGQVQYLARLPDHFGVLEEGLAERLAAAFARHPCVDKVTGVIIEAPRQVRVELVYRVPVLAVRYGGALRAVDARGILLPKEVETAGLPVFPGTPPPPAGAAGMRWGDAAVEAAAARAAGK